MGKISDALKKINKERELQKKFEKERYVRAKESVEPEKHREQNLLIKEPPRKASKRLPAARKGLFDKILPREQLEEAIQRFKLGTFFVAKPKDDSGIDPRVVTYHDYHSPVSEQYRLLRTHVKSHLRHNGSLKTHALKATRNAKVITVTSSLHSEGKSVTSVNLAIALAKDLESRVLLVDCDLRNGTIHKKLNLEAGPGLSDVLSGGLDHHSTLQKTNIDRLFVIPRGDIPQDPSELLGSKSMHVLLEKLKNELFSYIILDTPPVVPFTDAGVLGAQTDGVILVVQAHRTKAELVQKTKEYLENSRSKLLGFILTQSDCYTPNMYGYYHYYRHRNNGSK
ncbi:CpsD/CapB family tyrosine-protein kinase [Candidatus Omnitrophota bacterium]